MMTSNELLECAVCGDGIIPSVVKPASSVTTTTDTTTVTTNLQHPAPDNLQLQTISSSRMNDDGGKGADVRIPWVAVKTRRDDNRRRWR